MQLVTRRVSTSASATTSASASAATVGGTDILDLACGMGGDLLKWFTPSNNSKSISISSYVFSISSTDVVSVFPRIQINLMLLL
jgi:hypothetical protein